MMLERAKIEVNGLGGSYGPERLTLYEMQPSMGPPPATTWEFPPTDLSWRNETCRCDVRTRRACRDRGPYRRRHRDSVAFIEEAYDS